MTISGGGGTTRHWATHTWKTGTYIYGLGRAFPAQRWTLCGSDRLLMHLVKKRQLHTHSIWAGPGIFHAIELASRAKLLLVGSSSALVLLGLTWPEIKLEKHGIPGLLFSASPFRLRQVWLRFIHVCLNFVHFYRQLLWAEGKGLLEATVLAAICPNKGIFMRNGRRHRWALHVSLGESTWWSFFFNMMLIQRSEMHVVTQHFSLLVVTVFWRSSFWRPLSRSIGISRKERKIPI